MKALENVWDLVGQFTKNPKYVEISNLAIESWIDKLKEVEIKNEALPPKVSNDIEFYSYRRFHQTLDYKKPMDVYQESIKLNQEKKRIA